jgi:rhomboid protease GluP
MENETPTSNAYQVIRATWLSRSPRESALIVAGGMTLLLALVSLFYEMNWWHARDLMAASGESVFGRGENWRLLTTIFAHGDLGHLLSNSILFFILGFFLYGHFGAWLFPVSALLGGALTNFLVLPTYDPRVTLIGASGVVYWMGGAWLMLYFLLSQQKNLMHRWVRTLGVAILLFMPSESFEQAVSYRTHFAGFAVGTLSGALQYLTHKSEYLAAQVIETVVEPIELDPQYGVEARAKTEAHENFDA